MESNKRNAGKEQNSLKQEHERHQERLDDLHDANKTLKADSKAAPQKQWDENPKENTADPQQQQVQREWEQAQKEQQENAKRPGVDKNDLKQHDEQGNPIDRGEDLESEM